MGFSTKQQSEDDLNFVAIRFRFKELFCFPLLTDEGKCDRTQWIIEQVPYEPRIQHLRRLQYHKFYYIKKYWYNVDPMKYELWDLDEQLVDYYGKDVLSGKKENVIEDKSKLKDEELIKLVDSLEQRIKRRKNMLAEKAKQQQREKEEENIITTELQTNSLQRA